MARYTTFAFGMSAALLLTLSSGTALAQAAASQKTEQALPSIVVSQVETRLIVDRVMATGAVKAVDETYVSPLVDGLSIRTLNADVGDRVEAESTLATLNPDMLVLQKSQYAASLAKAEAAFAQYEAQLAEAQANADEAVRVSDRSKKLAEAGSMSTAQRDQEKAAATAALARVRSADQLVLRCQGRYQGGRSADFRCRPAPGAHGCENAGRRGRLGPHPQRSAPSQTAQASRCSPSSATAPSR